MGFGIREEILKLVENGSVESQKIEEAMRIGGALPDRKEWRMFVDQILLWFGMLALVFAVVFFVAYNWSELGKIGKFGMVEAALTIAIALYWKYFENELIQKISIMAASLLCGALLALFGQVYQTGADSWQLFAMWAFMITPWAILAKFDLLWLLWTGLVNTSMVLYLNIYTLGLWLPVPYGNDALWAVFVFNSIMLALWETTADERSQPLQRWTHRLIATAAGISISIIAVSAVTSRKGMHVPDLAIWTVWGVAMLYIYTRFKKDLYMITGVLLSAIVVSTAFISDKLFRSSDAVFGFLILSLWIVLAGTAAAAWLKKLYREWESNEN